MIRRERVLKRKVTNFLQSALLITGMLCWRQWDGLWLGTMDCCGCYYWDRFFSSSAQKSHPDWCFAFTRPARFRLMRLLACSAS